MNDGGTSPGEQQLAGESAVLDGGASRGEQRLAGESAVLDGGRSPSVGDLAPAFSAPDVHGARLALAGLRGAPVLVVFVPFAFTPVCTDEAAALQQAWPAWRPHGVRVLMIACDAVPTLRRWAEEQGVDFDVLSDFWPHGQVARAYGAFSERDGAADRVSVLIDAEGVIRWRTRAPRGVARPVEEYQAAIAEVLGLGAAGTSGAGAGGMR